MKCHYLGIFRKSVEKIQVSLKYNKNNEYFPRTQHLWQYRAYFVLESEIMHTKLEEQIKTHIFIFNIPPENHAVYEIMWKYVVQPAKSQMAI
jgi:hypothetical protein